MQIRKQWHVLTVLVRRLCPTGQTAKKGSCKKRGQKPIVEFAFLGRIARAKRLFLWNVLFRWFFLGAAHFECLKVRGAVARFPYP